MPIIRKVKFQYTIIFSVYIFLIGILLFTIPIYFLESNPIKNEHKMEFTLFSLVPQGWAFFTRNPRESQILLYRKNDDGRYTLDSQKQTDIQNYFGFKRRPSKMLAEFQFAKEEIPNFLFYDTVFNYQKESELAPPSILKVYKHYNKLKLPELCGEYIAVLQKPIPWAWSRNIDNIRMSAKIIKINFICS